jgi:hypothetical protein
VCERFVEVFGAWVLDGEQVAGADVDGAVVCAHKSAIYRAARSSISLPAREAANRMFRYASIDSPCGGRSAERPGRVGHPEPGLDPDSQW